MLLAAAIGTARPVAASVETHLRLRKALVQLVQGVDGLGSGAVGQVREAPVVQIGFVFAVAEKGRDDGHEAGV